VMNSDDDDRLFASFVEPFVPADFQSQEASSSSPPVDTGLFTTKPLPVREHVPK
jgi:hypothetical protein